MLALSFVFFLFFSCLQNGTVFASSQADDATASAPLIEQDVQVTLSGGQASGALLDSNDDTCLTLESGDKITVQSETPVHSIYLIWDRPPSEWALSMSGASLVYGSYGFLHEAVVFENAATEFSITLTQDSYLLCDIYLFGEGEFPEWVQLWQPPLEQADLLVLPTHADDEHLFYGGVMPTYAGEMGLDVQVAYMTSHWGERYRPHELLNGLWTVGITAYPIIGPFPDLIESLESLESATATYGYDEVLEFQVELLRRFEPLVVVGHDFGGEYGHGAHMLNAKTLADAISLANDEASFPESAEKYGVWEPHKVYFHLYEENEIVMEWDTPLSAFGGATGFEMAEAGFAQHLSQQGYFRVTTTGERWEDCRFFGLYHTTVGPDVQKNDMFENIELNRTPEPEAVSSEVVSSAPPVASSGIETPSSVAQAVSSPAVTSSGSSPLLWILLGVVAVILGIVLLAVILSKSAKKKRRHMREAHKKYYYKRK